MKKQMAVLAMFAMLGGLAMPGSTWGQGRTSGYAQTPLGIQPSNRRQDGPTEAGRPGMIGMQGDLAPMYVPGNRPGQTSARSELGRLVNQLREADDAKKADLTKQLEAAVAKDFDEDMKARETELEKLETRLAKLRAQLDRRRKAKDEIIQLHLKVLVNEAEGLGFSGASFSLYEAGAAPYGDANTPPYVGVFSRPAPTAPTHSGPDPRAFSFPAGFGVPSAAQPASSSAPAAKP